MLRVFLLFFVLNIFNIGQLKAQNNFYLQLRNGQVIESFNIIVKNPLFKKPFFLVDNTKEIEWFQVDKVNFKDGYFVARELPRGRNTALLNIEFEGPISVYYDIQITRQDNYPGYGYGAYGSYGPGFYERKKVLYFEKTKYNVQALTTRNLIPAVENHKPSFELAQKARKVELASRFTSIVGGAGLIYGLTQSTINPNTGTVKISPWTWVGMGVISIPIFFKNKREDLVNQAILTYNQAHRADK